MTSASNRPRPRKKPAAGADVKPDDAGRRIFRGVELPDVPVFSLESASDPEKVVEFTGIAILPAFAALRLLTDGVSSSTLPDLFEQILGEEQYKELEEFAGDPANGITLEVLIDLGKYLVEIYTSRPTKRSNGS